MADVLCPHCGARNHKSLIVTTCSHCQESLDGAEIAPPEQDFDTPPAPPPIPPLEPEAVADEAPPDESIPPPDEPVRPPVWEPPPAAEMPEAVDEPQVRTEPEPIAVEAEPTAAPPPVAQPTPTTPKPAATSPACLIVAVVVGGIFFFMMILAFALMRRMGPGALIPFAVIGGVVALIIAFVVFFVIRAKVAESFYELEVDPEPSVGLGETVTWGVVIRAKKPITVGAGTIKIKFQEHAISRGGTSDSHYRKALHEQIFQIPGKPAMPGEGVEIRVEIPIPAHAIPSHKGRNNFIEWSLEARAPVPGYCPDVKKRVSVTVRPKIAAELDGGMSENLYVAADWLAATKPPAGQAKLGEAWATLQATDGASIDQTPVMAVGETREFSLWVQTKETVDCRGVLCWVGCRVHGAGSDEKIVLIQEQTIHEGALTPDQPVCFPVQVTVPDSGPASYVGRYVKLEWVACVRLDIPLWFDKRLRVPFIVTPQRVQ